MGNELKDIRISLISLVGKAANKTTFICKSADFDSGPIRSEELSNFHIAKTDEEKRLVYGIVYPVGKEDTQGDFAIAAEVEKACHNFMIALDSTEKLDTGHNLQIAKGVNIVENYIVQKSNPLFPEDEGAWAIVVKVNNDEIWNAVKDGTYTGFSMWGEATRITPEAGTIEKEDEGMLKKLTTIIKNILNMDTIEKRIKLAKDFNAMLQSQDIRDNIWLLRDSFDAIYNDASITDKKAALLTNIDQFKARVESVDIAKEVITQIMDGTEISVEKAGKVLSDANLAKLQTAIDNINLILAAATVAKTKNTDMDEKTKTAVDAAVTAAVEVAKTEAKTELDTKVAELNTKIETLEKENKDLKEAKPGSGQDPDPAGSVEKSDAGINFISGL